MVRYDVVDQLDFCLSIIKDFFGSLFKLFVEEWKAILLLLQINLPFPSTTVSFHDPIFHLFYIYQTGLEKRHYTVYHSLLIFTISRLDMSMLLRPSGILGRAVVSARSAAVLVGSSSSSSNGRLMGTSTRHDNDPEVCYLQLPSLHFSS